MSIEENKRVVQAFMGLFEGAAITETLDMMTEDATWQVIGKPHLYSGAGVRTRAQMARIWPELYAKLEGGLQMRVTRMIAEATWSPPRSVQTRGPGRASVTRTTTIS